MLQILTVLQDSWVQLIKYPVYYGVQPCKYDCEPLVGGYVCFRSKPLNVFGSGRSTCRLL